VGATWTDLLDPDRDALRHACPGTLHPRALDRLLAPAVRGDEPRPTLEAHTGYVFGVFLVAVAVPDEDEVFYQEVDIVLTPERLVTVRKTPPDRLPFDPKGVRAVDDDDDDHSAGMVAYQLVDDVAESYLDLVDALNDEIDELEDSIETWPGPRIRARLSSLRHDMLQIRRTLAPTRDAVRRVVDNRVDLEGGIEVFSNDVELHFADAYDKLLRASEALELCRDLVAGARDYYQAMVAQDQNEIVKRLTAVASVLLVPTFIVGLYGQNFRDMPEYHWRFGYAWSWSLIIVSTVAQLIYFRRKRWL
jgi:magnesium transporter